MLLLASSLPEVLRILTRSFWIFASSAQSQKDTALIKKILKKRRRIPTLTKKEQFSKEEELAHLSIISNPTSSSNPVNIFLDLRRHVKVHHIGHLK